MITPAVFRDIIRDMPGDPEVRNAQANTLKWFWKSHISTEFKRGRVQELECRFHSYPSDPIAALLLTSAR